MKEFTGYLRGINLGGWLSQCGDHYHEEHYSSFIRESDIEKIASWGVDHVRLPVDYNVIQNEDGTFIPEHFVYIDRCIEWCRKYNLKIVLDLHKAAGYVFDNKNDCRFFTQTAMQDMFVALWKELTRRYGKYHDRIAFELLNEITAREMAEPWNAIAARTVRAIRALNQEVPIILGGIYNSSIYGLTLLEEPADDNIVFTFHCYSPMIFTHQAASWVENMPKGYAITYPGTVTAYRGESERIFGKDYEAEYAYEADRIGVDFFERLFAPALQIAEKYQVPLYCGEYGVIDQADPQSTVNWYRDINAALKKYNIPRAAWTYKRMDFGITDAHYADIYEQLLRLL